MHIILLLIYHAQKKTNIKNKTKMIIQGFFILIYFHSCYSVILSTTLYNSKGLEFKIFIIEDSEKS